MMAARGRRAHTRSRIEVGEGASFLRHARQIGSREAIAEGLDVGEAKVIDEDDNEVWALFGRSSWLLVLSFWFLRRERDGKDESDKGD